MKQICLLGAMPAEIKPFTRRIDCAQLVLDDLPECWQGEYADHDVTIVLTGVGKVNAAVATQIAIQRFTPDVVLSCGTAGSLDLQRQFGDVVIATETLQHDYGFIVPESFIHFGVSIRQGTHRSRFFKQFQADPTLLHYADGLGDTWQNRFHIVRGSIVTGDQVILAPAKRQALVEQFQAVAVDMESAAIAQVAAIHDIPFLSIRGISDYCDDSLELDISQLDPNEIAAFSAASLPQKFSIFTKAINYLAHHPSAFRLTRTARQRIKRASLHSAECILALLRKF